MSGLEIRVLGELDVRRAGAPVALPHSKKTRALLAFLDQNRVLIDAMVFGLGLAGARLAADLPMDGIGKCLALARPLDALGKRVRKSFRRGLPGFGIERQAAPDHR